MSGCLFVYGTLRRGQGNPFAARLERLGAWLGPARLRGRLYHLHHYPGIVASRAHSDWVRGELYQLPGRDTLLRFLDRYEGPEFARRQARAVRPSGEALLAWYYAYTGPLHGATHIPHGDYVRWLTRSGCISDWPSIQSAG